MRNLKKVLALVLALVMSLSLVTIANAADFSDKADIDYGEAVDVMSTIGVIDGVGNNSFDPNGTLTREQAAKLITYMLLGENSEKLGVEGTSFKDVAATRWSAPAIEYCASLGIIDGAGDGNFYPAGRLTGFAFAKMLLTALGYDSEIEKFVGAGWTIPVATIGMEVGLDNGLEKTFGNAELTRQEAAQMALNAIKAPLVHYPNKGNSVSVNGVVVDFTSQQYEYITTTIARTQTISDQMLSNSTDYTIEFGEKYLPKLELRKETDDFGRPSYTWAYDKKEIGTYLDDTDLVAEFTTKVTGQDLYDVITKNVIDHLEDDKITVTIDGDDTDNEALFTKSVLTKTNKDKQGATEKGVLTQVFVSRIEGTRETTYDVKVVIINTYLAIATEDYDSKNEDVQLKVYALGETDAHTKNNPDYIKDKTLNEAATVSVTVKNDDVNVEDVKEDDMYLVTVAAGKVQTMVAPEVVAEATIDSFKQNKDVTVEGKTYEYADTAKYDEEVLDDYSQTNLKDITYNVILDQYGYLIGIEQNEDPDQYLFLTGLEGNYSYLSNKDADANVIFMDGSMKTITVNTRKSKPITNAANNTWTEGGNWTDTDGDNDDNVDRNYSQINTWCTYSVDSNGVYTLKEVATAATGDPKVMQKPASVGAETKIDKKNVTLPAISGKAYGNDDTVYINVELEDVKTKTTGNLWFKVIDDVDSVTTGTKNVSLKIAELGSPADGSSKANAKVPANEVYTLYKDNGYIVSAVTIGESDSVSKTYAYIHTEDGRAGVDRERYDKANDEWIWTREAIVDGKIVELKEVGGGTDLSELEGMTQNTWYELKLDADGNVKDAIEIKRDAASGVAPTNPPHSSTTKGAALAKDYVFCFDYTNHIADPANADYPKFIGKAEMVDDAIDDNDTVILFQNGFEAPTSSVTEDKEITYKNGTLYVGVNDTKGFDVSPEVKTVLCLSDGEGGDFDDVDDNYTGYSGLERAISRLDSNFTGDLSVIFDKGSAVVIIFNDTTDADDTDNDDNNGDASGVVVKGDLTQDSATAATLLVYDAEGHDDVLTNEEIYNYLTKTLGYKNVKYSGGKWSYDVSDWEGYTGVAITQTQTFKVSLSSSAKAANAKGVTFTISDFSDQYVTAAAGYTVEVVVTGALSGTTKADGVVAATASATVGTPAAKSGVTPSANMASPATAGTISTGITDAGATTGTYTVKISGMSGDCVVSISAS